MKNIIQHSKKSLTLSATHLLSKRIIASCLMLAVFGANSTQAFNPIHLQYSVLYNGASVGYIETRIEGKDNQYQIQSTTRAEGIASILLGGDLTQNCQFTTDKNEVRSEKFITKKEGTKAFSNSISYDWNAQKINFNNGEAALDMPKGYVVDNCNFHFAAAFTDREKLKSTPIYVVDGKKQRIRGYQFVSSNKETIKTPAGEFNTTKIVLKRELNDNKTITFWLTDDANFYPIKFMDSRKGSNRVMVLKTMSKS